MKSLVLVSALALGLGACAYPDAQGNVTVTERSAALGNLWSEHSSRVGGPFGSVYEGPCNKDDVRGCTQLSQWDRNTILTALKTGKLYAEAPDGTKSLIPPTARVE